MLRPMAGRDDAQLGHQALELRREHRLRPVAQRAVRVAVHLDDAARRRPAATAARAIGATLSRRPVPWLGSTKTGRWLSFLTTGIAEMSSVLRV